MLIAVNEFSYGKLYLFQNSLGFCELPEKVKFQFSDSYVVLLTTFGLVFDDFETF